MAAFNFFDSFTAELTAGTHTDAINADTDTLRVYLTNEPPNATTHTTYEAFGASGGAAFLPEINAAATGYTIKGYDVGNAFGGTANLQTVTAGGTPTWTAGAADWTAFQYIVLMNDDNGDKLIGWWDNGTAVTLANTQTFTPNLAAPMLTFGATA